MKIRETKTNKYSLKIWFAQMPNTLYSNQNATKGVVI